MKIPSILIIGNAPQAGTYLLWIRLKEDAALQFGGFRRENVFDFSSRLSSGLVSLFQKYQRLDVLEYHWEPGKMPRRIVVAEWNMTACKLNRHTMIGGANL